MVTLSQKKLQHKTINLPSYIISTYTLIPQISILIHFVEPSTGIDREGLINILSLPRFSETEIREQQKYKKRIQTSVDNTADDQLHEIKFENRVKNKKTFFY